MYETELHIEDGRAHCPNDDCDWFVPKGMEYLYGDHDCEGWD